MPEGGEWFRDNRAQNASFLLSLPSCRVPRTFPFLNLSLGKYPSPRTRLHKAKLDAGVTTPIADRGYLIAGLRLG